MKNGAVFGGLFLTLVACIGLRAADDPSPPVPHYTFRIVKTYPHDSRSFTEGLFFWHGSLYESTGLVGKSSIREVALPSGQIVRSRALDSQFFGEGIVNWGEDLISLTYTSHVGLVYRISDFQERRRFTVSGEGWGLTQDGRHLIMSDGSADLRLLDPVTLQETSRVHVTYQGHPVSSLNELEWVQGKVYANVWPTTWIGMIDPNSGNVVGVVDLSKLALCKEIAGDGELNGIAYDKTADRLFVTGKFWHKVVQIKLIAPGGHPGPGGGTVGAAPAKCTVDDCCDGG